jgi:hypothetical protein
VAKIRLSNADLTAIFYERIRESSGCPQGISVAIIPNKSHGWTALMSPAQRNGYPMFGKRFDTILQQLRKTYDLPSD